LICNYLTRLRNVNCSPGPHVKRTGDVKAIKIARVNHRNTKKELEFVFEVSADSSSAPTQPAEPKKRSPTSTLDEIPAVSDAILADMLAVLKQHNIDLGDKQEAIQAALRPKVKQHLTIMKNLSYTKGFTATKGIQSRML
jgi:hypothetical protein